jgi:hypothetical protein
MLKRLTNAAAIAAFACLVIGFGVLVAASSRKSPSDKQPQHTTNQSSTPKSTHDPDKITDWLLVVLNFFLVGSTLMLWVANNRSAKIAERALTGLERPRILSVTPSFAITQNGLATQIYVYNLGRDPGRIKEIHVNFIEGDLPPDPDFRGAQVARPDTWMLPIASFGAPRQAGQGFPFNGRQAAKFLAVKILYEWDFGKHVHAFAVTVVAAPLGGPMPSDGPQSAGGKAYNYDT